MVADTETEPQVDPAEIIERPFTHLLQPGPEYRNFLTQLVSCFNFWINCPKDTRRKALDKIFTAFHNTLLIADDLEDEAKLRRGIPTAHMVYGIPLTVQATIHKSIVLLENLLELLEDNKDDIIDEFLRLGVSIFTGQELEIYYRNLVICSTFEDYSAIIYGKSTAVLMWAVKLLPFAKKDDIKFPYGIFDKLGHFMQIYNDYINLHNSKYATVRGFCDDLDEGKFSYPMIHAIQSHPNDHRLLNMLKKRPLNVESKKRFVEIMESFGSFEYTRTVLEDLRKGILEDVTEAKLEKNPRIERVLQKVLDCLETEIYFDGCD